MKLIAAYTRSHERLTNEWFLPTIRDEYELKLHRCDVEGHGRYMERDWTEAVLFKCGRIIEAIRENPGEILVYSDVDVQFFGPTKDSIREAIVGKDIVCQLDSPNGQVCTGFFAVRANDATLGLWEEVRACVRKDARDQPAFNRILRERKIQFGCLPLQFFGTGTFFRKMWDRDGRFYIPKNPLMFHANWTVGVDNKLALLRTTRKIVEQGRLGVARNNLMLRFRIGSASRKTALLAIEERSVPGPAGPGTDCRPSRVCLDASTVCQLKCPSCPTADGTIGKKIGGGFLSLENFARFVREHAWVKDIELSNWGEILLNPELIGILEYAHERSIVVRAGNGVNLNRASDEVLEALVKYKVRKLACSIDGASRETYGIYRVKGDFDRVIGNVEKINEYKRRHGSRYPELYWQFVVFGHNEHEIGEARRIAKRLNMQFVVKLSWDELYTEAFSPVVNRETVRREAGLGVADRSEYEQRYGRSYAAKACAQLWKQPRINHDGRLLGCSINHWGDYGNVFEDGLETCLKGERMTHARQMLTGNRPARDDIPCAACKVFESMRKTNTWVMVPQ